MKLLNQIVYLSALVIRFASAQERSVPELEVLMQQYAADVQLSAGAKYENGISELNRSYSSALDRALKAAQNKGGLEEALAIKNELALISAGKNVPISDEGTPPTLKNLRVVYRQSAARLESEKSALAAPLAKSLVASLDQLVATLTKAGRLEDAVIIKQKKESLIATIGTPAALSNAPLAIGQKTFTNSLGMKFVTVPGTDVLFCIHETRRSDFAAYAAQDTTVGDAWKNQNKDGVAIGDKDDHPVVSVSWDDANGFCQWLSKKEGKTYRLPTDNEWSLAVGIGKDETKGKTPHELSGKIPDEFPWGAKWPPPKGAGNYADSTAGEKLSSQAAIEGYTDGFPTTAPVMSFKPNRLGLYDLGGNVWELCDDWYNSAQKERVARGGSWNINNQNQLLSSYRVSIPPNSCLSRFGFRCVLAKP